MLLSLLLCLHAAPLGAQAHQRLRSGTAPRLCWGRSSMQLTSSERAQMAETPSWVDFEIDHVRPPNSAADDHQPVTFQFKSVRPLWRILARL